MEQFVETWRPVAEEWWQTADDYAQTWKVKEHQPIIDDYPYLPIYFIIPYVIFVFAGQRYMANRPAFKITWTVRIWNFFLSVLSLWMFLAMFINGFLFLRRHGLYILMCQSTDHRGVGDGWSYWALWVFAMSKYFELLDTVWLVMKKRPVIFLHWYHHVSVLAYTYFCMIIHAQPGLVFACVNSFVHTIMYFYYFLASCGSRPTWGMYVTVIQLTQMVFGIGTAVLWTYYWMTREICILHYPEAGSHFVIASIILYGSYLLLFLQFFINRFLTPKSAPKKKTQ